MSLNSMQWGMLAKVLYKIFFREQLQKAVKSTENKFDDKALAEVDKMITGGKNGKQIRS